MARRARRRSTERLLADQFYGDRAGRVRDPFGHHWIIATRVREVPEEEMVAAFQAMFEHV